jgi:hypothetical protein
MRAMLACIGVVVAAVACGSAAAAVAIDHGSARGEFVAGGGTFGPSCTLDSRTGRYCDGRRFSFQVFATETPSGGVIGRFQRVRLDTGGTFIGRVTCVSTDGVNAAVGGIVTHAPGPGGAGIPFRVFVREGATALGDGISPFEVFPPGDPGWKYVPADFPKTCPLPISLLGYFPLTSGGVLVHQP